MKPTHLLLLSLCIGLVPARAEKISALPASVPILTADHVNLSAAFFWREWAAADKLANARAGLYLLGVADSTEGKSWCGYGRIKPDTLNEYVFLHFKSLPADKMKNRAALVIEEALAKNFPCKT